MGFYGEMILMLCLVGFAYSASAVEDQSFTLERIDTTSFSCEELPTDHCAFAVSSSGSRCVLETRVLKNGEVELECQSSDVVTSKFSSWIESSSCINACGLNQMSVGLSTDFLGEKELQRSICASPCIDVCSNIEELFTMLAGGEGVSLRSLCDAYKPAPVAAAVEHTPSESVEFAEEDAATSAVTEAAASADSTAPVVVAAPRKLIQDSVAYAAAPAGSFAWTADRRMLYNLASASAYAAYAPASSPVYTDAPTATVTVSPVVAPVSVFAAASVAVVVAAPASSTVVPVAAPAPSSF